MLGCLMGFIGILFLHVGNAIDNSFIWQGDGMIILNALCGAAATLMTRRLSKEIDIFVGTGYSLTIGGSCCCCQPGQQAGICLLSIYVVSSSLLS